MRGRLLGALAALAPLMVVAVAAAQSFPDRIALPGGWRPEGIAAGTGNVLYVGSIPTGAVRRIDARTGSSSTLVTPRSGRAAIGLKLHGRRLFVAGGPTGKAFVYDSRTGRPVKSFQLAPAGQETFLNDVAVTDDAAYFTESRRPALYVVDTDLSGGRELALRGFTPAPGNNHLNGIVATADGETLIGVQGGEAGRLWRVDPQTGRSVALRISGGAPAVNGDGLLLDGRTLYVVQNRLNRVAIVRLDERLTGARLVRVIRDEDLDVPTTLARLGDRFYAVNARFSTEATPATEYWVTRLSVP